MKIFVFVCILGVGRAGEFDLIETANAAKIFATSTKVASVMSDHYDKIIEDAEKKLSAQEEAANHTRRFINQVLEFAGREPRFNLDDFSTGFSQGKATAKTSIVRNEYYGKPLAFCVRDFLERRNGPVREATLDEIFSALEQGNYDLKKSGNDKDTQRRGVAISLAKNTKAFHKLPNGDFGLAEWYESVRKKSPKPGPNSERGHSNDIGDDWDSEDESKPQDDTQPSDEMHPDPGAHDEEPQTEEDPEINF